MQMVHTTRRRWLGGPVLLTVMMIVLTGCNVHIGWKSTMYSSTTGRSPETFVPACAEIGGTLVEVSETAQAGAQSVCTVEGGDKVTCHWTADQCVVECFTSDEACAATVEFMGYVPPGLSGTPVASIPVPTVIAAFSPPPSPHLAGAA